MNLKLKPVNVRESAAAFLTPLPLHIAAVVVLTVLNIYLVLHLVFAFGSAHSNNDEALAQAASQVRANEIAASPLRGLDKKLAVSEDAQAKFYVDRLPTAYSTVAAQLGTLAHANNVRLSRVQYKQAPGLDGPPEAALTEVDMDATLTGDYRPLMQFLNGLERSRTFFMVNSITLSGQQSGTVNLRMRLLTYLRSPKPGEAVNDSPTSGDTADSGEKP